MISIAAKRLPLEHNNFIYVSSFGTERYLNFMINSKFRVSLSGHGASSNDVKIVRGRYVRPNLNVDQWFCQSCNVDHKERFTTCNYNKIDRAWYISKVLKRD